MEPTNKKNTTTKHEPNDPAWLKHLRTFNKWGWTILLTSPIWGFIVLILFILYKFRKEILTYF